MEPQQFLGWVCVLTVVYIAVLSVIYAVQYGYIPLI